MVLTIEQSRELIYGALVGSGTLPENTSYLTDAILDKELFRLKGQGLYWL